MLISKPFETHKNCKYNFKGVQKPFHSCIPLYQEAAIDMKLLQQMSQ